MQYKSDSLWTYAKLVKKEVHILGIDIHVNIMQRLKKPIQVVWLADLVKIIQHNYVATSPYSDK